MPKKIIIAEQERIAALLSDERVDKLIVAQGRYQIGDIYIGTIENVLPGIDAAFVNIGASEQNGFIHVSDLGPLKLKKGAASITELLEPRQKVVVQVMKEPTGNKGPRLTGNISLPGRYLFLQPNGQGVNVSRGINIENERNRLKALGVLIKPPGTGLTIRSEAEDVSEEFIIDDLENLLKKWELIQQAADNSNPPTLLNRDEDFINRVLRDHINSEFTEIVVETNEGKERAKRFFEQEESNINVIQLSQPCNLLQAFKIDLAILNALKPRVDLPSGGYIIIEPTEALTVIDVNSGSFTRSANSRETVLWTNCEAAIEIARQLQLRNIGGVIIIDFIDMESRRDQLQLLEYFTAAIKNDSSRPQISQLTELGLVELTRKRQGQNIYELFSKECPHCSGLGHVSDIPEKGSIEPSALNTGLIKSDKNISNDVSSKTNNYIEANKNSNIKKLNFVESNVENINTKEEKEEISIKMNDDQEYVFSDLGLSPTLLLDVQPKNDNFSIKVIRYEEDMVIEESNNISTIELKESSDDDQNNNTDLEKIDYPKLDNLNIDSSTLSENNESKVELINNKDEEIHEDNQSSLNNSEDDVDDTRRRRRRSSASN